MIRHPYHMVEPSPWPMMSAIGAMLMAMGMINLLYENNLYTLITAMMIMLLSITQWWRDMTREATYMGKHTTHVQKSMRLGMLLFISSEICFFMTFFWTFFHSSMTPTPELGCCWPPMGISTIDQFGVPLLNTTILLTSGATVTWSHNSMLLGSRYKTIFSLSMTMLLGMYFTILQITEYKESTFTIADSVFGSIFFMSTGFHGIHVIIGTIFLSICLLRLMKFHFSKMHHFGFEAAAWYWHFVDVVWICLYICMYWWGHL